MKSSLLSIIRMKGEKGEALTVARSRLAWVSAVFTLAYILMAIRIFDLSIIQGELTQDAGAEMALTAPAPTEVRADITDRNGILLATTLKTSSLYADPALVTDPVVLAQGLSEAVPGLVYGDVLRKLQGGGRFVWLKRNLTPGEQQAVLMLGHPALGFRDEVRRVYPQGPLTAHITGYTNIDGQGLGGIERSFDSLLSTGQPVQLTIDARLQHAMRREIKAAVDSFTAKGGAGIILDVASGEILAAVSLPDFDPHSPGKTDIAALFNKTTQGVYELGSVFKVFSTAAYLETQKDALRAVFDVREPLKRGRFTISDYHPEERMLTLPEVFIYSSNIGTAQMGEIVGTETLRGFYNDLGLLSQLELEISETGKPLYPDPWRDINTLTASYGHGVAVSPLQMTAAAASIVGDGTLVHPVLVMKTKTDQKSTDGRDLRIVSPQTAHRMRQLMRLAVTDGTGTKADVPGYDVGGKTGTAEQPGTGGYNRRQLVSSFLGFFPMASPRYAVFIMIDEPKGNKASFGYATGGWVAAPVAAHVIESMISVLGVRPVETGNAEDFAETLRSYIHAADHMQGGALASY